MIKLAVISEGVNTWPLYVAQTKRMFSDAGVEVRVTLTGSSTQQLAALREGGYDIGFQQSDHVIRAVEQGSDLCIFMAQAHAPELTLVAAADIQSIAGLKNKIIVVDGPRTGYSLLLRKLFKDHGFTENEMRLVEFGGSRERFDAMRRGAGSACFINAPFDRDLLALGFRSLGKSDDFFADYPGAVAAARRSWAATHAPELRAFISAYNRAYAWLHDPANNAEAVEILPDRLRPDGDFALRALRTIHDLPPPRISAGGLRQVIDIVWDAEGYDRPKGLPEKYLDLGYTDKAPE